MNFTAHFSEHVIIVVHVFATLHHHFIMSTLAYDYISHATQI